MSSTSNQPAPVRSERLPGVLRLSIDVPATRNALSSPGVLEGLLAGLDELERDATLRCAILTGAGGCFSAGGDLRQLAVQSEDQTRALMQANAGLYRRIATIDKPVIAAVDGPAFGAGLGLALCCDLVLAGASARFCCAFVRVGAMPDAGLFSTLPARVGIARARRLMLFGEEIGGAEALAMGLVDEYAADASAAQSALAWAERLVAGPPLAQARIKAGLRRFPMSLDEALDWQVEQGPRIFASQDFKEGAAAFFEKRRPSFRGR